MSLRTLTFTAAFICRYDRRYQATVEPSCGRLRPEVWQSPYFCKKQNIQDSSVPQESIASFQHHWTLPAHNGATEGSHIGASVSMTEFTEFQTSVLYWNQHLPDDDTIGNISRHQVGPPEDQSDKYNISTFECRRVREQAVEQREGFYLFDQQAETDKSLKVHRPYLCTQCGKSFIQKAFIRYDNGRACKTRAHQCGGDTPHDQHEGVFGQPQPSPPHELTQENNKVIVTVIAVQPRASANPNFASASAPGASPPRLVAIRAPPDGHLRCAEAHLDSVDDAVVLEDR
ncbi:hypothetical protein M513_02852 [Trichuris suis]|uniref:C2H2-type domain-containing protein n=1 Tax=Trichuris suis TaxID=68888 RepID=A0A085MGQ1_9BILA|nr:hypothetical protein M513_02852 [Trichuris suis]